jgi:uncharacterized protein DUF2336
MMPEEWPIAASAADLDSPARGAGRDRLSTVRADFFLDPTQRLSEQERALMSAMLHCLVGDIADEIHARLPLGWGAANDESNAALLDRLTAARLLDEARLIGLLLRRADEDRIGTAARARNGRREARALQGLVSHENSAVSAAAMAVILARGRRRDRFGQCLVDFDDLAPASAELLVNAIAAGLRHDLAARHGAGTADQALVRASSEILARRDPSRAIDELTAGLARLLDEIGALSDELILAAANDGEIGFVAHGLSSRGGIPGSSAMEELLSASPARIMRLLRAVGSSRDLAAGLLAGIGDLLGIADPGEAIDAFDRITADQAEAARASLSAAPAYRTALATLEKDHG